MYVTARERSILQRLLDGRNKTTIQTLADELGVSTRTIQRDLKGVEDILTEHHLTLERKAGTGLVVRGEKQAREQLRDFLLSLRHEEYTPEERQLLLLTVLLQHREPIKLFALANNLNVTVATVSHDLTKVEKWLEDFRLTLVRKRGYGVEIKGEERDVRRAIGALINENLNEAHVYRAIASRISEREEVADPISERLLHLMDLQMLRDVQRAVESLRKQFSEHMADSSYFALIVHVALAIDRIRQGKKIEMAPEYLQKLTMHKEYHLASRLAHSLERTFGIDIPDEEIGYMSMYLRGAKLREERDDLLEESNLQLTGRVKQLIDGVEDELQTAFHDESLFKGLLSHLKPALYRVRQGMKIYNPLLEEIKADNPDLFHIVRKQAQRVLDSGTIPDEEIGFLVMHFGSAIERRKRLSAIKALVVCSSGIGSSKLLMSRLQKEFPEITTIENASLFDVEEKNVDDYDLLISTIPLKNVADYFLVTPFLWTKEVDQIRDFLRSYQPKQPVSPRDLEQRSSSTEQIIDRFEQMASVNEDIVSILTHFQVKELEKNVSLEDGLDDICRDFERSGLLSGATSVVEALLAREQVGGVAIPETSLALFHVRTEEIEKPCVSMCELKAPALRKGMDGMSVPVKRALVLLAPLNLSEQRLSLMSSISALLIKSEAHTTVFEKGSETEIRALLAESCQNYVRNLINQGVDDE